METATPPYCSLLQLQQQLRDLVAACPGVRNCWIVAELSDVAERGGHCYMNLIQKDTTTGETLANARATIWRNVWAGIKHQFMLVTGQPFATGLVVLVKATANYHPVYGMSLNITDVNPSFTMGERERRRREILNRLKADGVYDLNRNLDFPRPLQRIAIISAPTAAGFGDFCKQLINNPYRLRFRPKLFPATVQGANTARSVIAQLNAIAADMGNWDCVCIIRGGGASTDLDGFDDYELASNVAQFPLPVIVGIGHERDTTVLDYIAAKRVKTPTAAAEFIVSSGAAELGTLQSLGSALLQTTTDILGGARQQLAYISGQLPTAPVNALSRAEKRLDNLGLTLGHIAAQRLQPLSARLDRLSDALQTVCTNRIAQADTKLRGYEALTAALSPAATLSRGFSITRIDGKAVTDASSITSGARLETELARGIIISTVQKN